MKGKVKLISSLVLIGMLFTLTGAAWAAEPTAGEGLRGQVAVIDGNTVLVATRGGEEHRVVTDEDTGFRIPAVSEPTIADIDIGDFIGVRGERNENGDLLAEVIIVLPAEYALYRNIARGEVLATEDSMLTVQTRLGEKLVITNEETRFRIPGAEEPSLEDISVGDPVLAVGWPDEKGNLLARVVAVVTGPQLQRHSLRGLVTSIEGDTLGVTTRRGEIQVETSEDTAFRIPGVEDPGIDDLNLRDLVVVLGTWDAEQEVFMARAVGLIPRWPSHLRFIRGEVTGIEDRTIVLNALQGEMSVLTDGETIFRIPGVEDPGLDDLRVGDRVGMLVARTEAGTLLAKVVVVRKGESSFTTHVMAPIEAATALMEDLLW
jgi:RNase P/RNase MRP subunit p29